MARIRRACRAILSGRPDIDIDDVCQDVLVQMCTRRFARRYDPRRNFETYLGGVIRNVARGALRREGGGLPLPEDWPARSEGGPMAAAERAEFMRAVGAIIDDADVDERKAIHDAVCGALERPVPGRRRAATRYARDFRCRRQLRRRLWAHRPGDGSSRPARRRAQK